MGWFLRKSVGIGPIRFNFSKSGIGASVGVKGARISMGPKGTHIFMGRGGLYYRQRINGATHSTDMPTVLPPNHEYTSESELQEIKTASIDQLIDSSSDDLLNEIADKHQKTELFIVGCWLLVGLFLLISYLADVATGMIILPLGLGLIPLKKYDEKNKSVKLDYDLDEDAKYVYECLVNSIKSIENCHKIWRINAQGETRDRKRNAGASTLVRRNKCSTIKAAPKFMITNIDVYQINCSDQKLCFLPDRLLIYQGKKVGAVQYQNIIIETDVTRFIEDEGIPSDGKQVGETWRYVNKNGSPDRRFSNNKQLPILLYGVINISSPSGLNLQFNCSNSEVPEAFKIGIIRSGNFLNQEKKVD